MRGIRQLKAMWDDPRMKELSADTRQDAREAGESIKKKLEDVQEHIKDGWDNVSDAVSDKLNKWLDD